MTSDEMMKKLGLRENKVWGGKKSKKIKDQVFKFLKEGKTKILLLEKQIGGEKNVKKLQEAKQKFVNYEKKAEQYIEKNPKKAAAMAAAAGALVGSFWSSLRAKKPVLKKKSRNPKGVTKPLAPRRAATAKGSKNNGKLNPK